MTKEQAVARKAALLNDREWAKRYMAGGHAEREEMRRLLHTVAGVPAPTGTSLSIGQTKLNALRADREWSKRYIEGDVKARAEATELHHAIAAAEDGE
jgi:hypothetical protein